MIALSDHTDKAIRAQIAESVALIAELDFPVKWTDLIDVRDPCLTTSSQSDPFTTATHLITLTNGLQH
jgi:hypothetical protein